MSVNTRQLLKRSGPTWQLVREQPEPRKRGDRGRTEAGRGVRS